MLFLVYRVACHAILVDAGGSRNKKVTHASAIKTCFDMSSEKIGSQSFSVSLSGQTHSRPEASHKQVSRPGNQSESGELIGPVISETDCVPFLHRYQKNLPSASIWPCTNQSLETCKSIFTATPIRSISAVEARGIEPLSRSGRLHVFPTGRNRPAPQQQNNPLRRLAPVLSEEAILTHRSQERK